MNSILALLVGIAALIQTMQSSPDVTPEMRNQVLEISRQAVALSIEELESQKDLEEVEKKEKIEREERSRKEKEKDDMTDENTNDAVAADAGEEGSVEVKSKGLTTQVYSTGFANQVLGIIEVENNTDESIVLGGSEADIKRMLGVSISEGEISFLFHGPKKSQYDLTSKNAVLEPGDSAQIDMRLKHAPGSIGSFTLSVGNSENTIQVVDPE